MYTCILLYTSNRIILDVDIILDYSNIVTLPRLRLHACEICLPYLIPLLVISASRNCIVREALPTWQFARAQVWAEARHLMVEHECARSSWQRMVASIGKPSFRCGRRHLMARLESRFIIFASIVE